jgi:hypothetical protein
MIDNQGHNSKIDASLFVEGFIVLVGTEGKIIDFGVEKRDEGFYYCITGVFNKDVPEEIRDNIYNMYPLIYKAFKAFSEGKIKKIPETIDALIEALSELSEIYSDSDLYSDE